MSTPRGPLARCCNGCDSPPQHPSWVLCATCLAKLDAKMEAMFGPLPEDEEAEQQEGKKQR